MVKKKKNLYQCFLDTVPVLFCLTSSKKNNPKY